MRRVLALRVKAGVKMPKRKVKYYQFYCDQCGDFKFSNEAAQVIKATQCSKLDHDSYMTLGPVNE